MKKERQDFSERQAKMTECLQGNEIIVLPSLDITPLNKMPYIDIIEENLNMNKVKKDRVSNSSTRLMHQKLVDFNQSINKISHEYMKDKGKGVSVSDSTKLSR